MHVHISKHSEFPNIFVSNYNFQVNIYFKSNVIIEQNKKEVFFFLWFHIQSDVHNQENIFFYEQNTQFNDTQ